MNVQLEKGLETILAKEEFHEKEGNSEIYELY